MDHRHKNRFSMRLPVLFALLLCDAVPISFADEGTEFFEKRIRPVLVNHCYSCHSGKAKRLRGKLRLDSRAHMLKGGQNGPAIIPGQPEKSLLVQALLYQDLEMPPRGKLPDRVIADFRAWIKMDAPDPRTGKLNVATKKGIDWQAAKKHWAFQPIRNPKIPRVDDPAWSQSPIDRFVFARLQGVNLTPSPVVDRRTLLRRLSLDLTGLPPTYEQVKAFEKDSSPEALTRVVDRMLGSPRYGERWGRHWLDVARYSDTKDLVLVFGKDRIRPYAYTYRDYVIRAFNEDTPYNQFVIEQLAADHVAPKVETWRLAAMGFLTLGRLFDNNLPDIYDDQIDTVTRGFLGLTVSCARCHDHKYDPIPTADYYSLYGVFANCERPIELPIIRQPSKTKGYLVFRKQYDQKRQRLKKHIDSQYNHIKELVRKQTPRYLQEVTEKPNPIETAIFFLSLSPDDLRPQITARWRRYLDKLLPDDDPVFGPWRELNPLSASEFRKKTPKIIQTWISKREGVESGEINPLVRAVLKKADLKTQSDLAKVYGELIVRTYQLSKTQKKLLTPAQQQVVDHLTSQQSPTFFPKSNTYMYMSRVPRGTYGGLLQQIDRLATDSPDAPPRAMVLRDAPELHEPRVFVRGNPRRPGQQVPRQFLKILAGVDRKPFPNGSGRLDLARKIIDPKNPLTARVIVNRVWMHHFGQPLVATPSDFGTRSDPPSHPELLDYLAWTFIHKDGWSLKKLHRRIVLSRTYQQASLSRPECKRIDPENKLLWKYNRRHMDLESMRDSLLFVSGRLDSTMGGPSQNVAGNAKNQRRTVYGLVDRQELPGLYRTFNFANPEQTAAKRPRTTVPQQALFAMNSPFMMEQAVSIVARAEVANATSAEARIQALYRLAFQRNPTKQEIEIATSFIQATEKEQRTSQRSQLTPWQQYAQVLLSTNEFVFAE